MHHDLITHFTKLLLGTNVKNIDDVIVRPLSTVGYTSVAVDSGLTNLIHDHYWRLSKREINTLGWLDVSTQA